MDEYHLSRTLAYFAFVTTYLLGQTAGGIVCAPVSETFGRRTLYIVAAILFCVFSAVVAAVPSVAAVYVGRFFQGVAAAIPATVAFGNFEDMFAAQARIWVVYGYTVAGFIGLALGPVYASYVVATCGWRWVFYIATMVAGLSAALSFGVRESKATQLLAEQAKALRADESPGRRGGGAYHNVHAKGASSGGFSLATFAREDLVRPLTFLATEPIVTFCAALCGIAFGLLYGLTEGLTVAYTTPPFDQTFDQTSSSLAFVAILLGILLDVVPRFYDDRLFRRFRAQRRRITPESKIRSLAVTCPLLAVGLWIFAWTVPPRVTTVPWPVSMVGLVLLGVAATDFSYVLFGYVTDSYGAYAASAVSCLSTTRTIAAAVFPLFAYQMFSGLGANLAATILAAVATVFGAVAPFLFLGYGSALRRTSKTASDDDDCLTEENEHMKEQDSGNHD